MPAGPWIRSGTGLVVCLGIALSAVAQEAERRGRAPAVALQLTGRVSELCRLGPFRVVESTPEIEFRPPDGIRLEVPAEGEPGAPEFRLRLRAEAMCNFVHGVSVASVEGALLRRPRADVAGFTDRIDYRVQLVFPVGRANARITFRTDRPPARTALRGNPPAAGPIELLVEGLPEQPVIPLLAGVYGDELRLVLGEP